MRIDSSIASAGKMAYEAKDDAYFKGRRPDIVEMLPQNPKAVLLEVGCGAGATGELALAKGKCVAYFGIELFDAAADEAAGRLTQVITGDVETLEFPWPTNSFDGLIFSEVLEHLVDPWAVVSRLRPLLKPNAIVLASSPNVSHHMILRMLIRGEWQLADAGPLDRTHLRWFTPRSYRAMFESCGVIVDEMSRVDGWGWKARMMNVLSFGVASHLLTRQIMLRGHVE